MLKIYVCVITFGEQLDSICHTARQKPLPSNIGTLFS